MLKLARFELEVEARGCLLLFSPLVVLFFEEDELSLAACTVKN
jgi:hypothetical protein